MGLRRYARIPRTVANNKFDRPEGGRSDVALWTGILIFADHASLGRRDYVGLDGRIIARREFGASAPIKDLLRQFGFTPERVVAEALSFRANVKAMA